MPSCNVFRFMPSRANNILSYILSYTCNNHVYFRIGREPFNIFVKSLNICKGAIKMVYSYHKNNNYFIYSKYIFLDFSRERKFYHQECDR